MRKKETKNKRFFQLGNYQQLQLRRVNGKTVASDLIWMLRYFILNQIIYKKKIIIIRDLKEERKKRG